MTERNDHYLVNRVAEGGQRTAQGGIVPVVEAPPTSQPSEDFAFIPIVKGASDIERFVERVIEIPACVPTEPSTNAAVAGSSNDERTEDIAIDEGVDIGGASGCMDLDVVESNMVEGITLASGRKCDRVCGQWSPLPVSGTGSVRAGRHRRSIMGDGIIAKLRSGGARTVAPVAPRAATAGETDRATETEHDSDLRDFMQLFEASERSEGRARS